MKEKTGSVIKRDIRLLRPIFKAFKIRIKRIAKRKDLNLTFRLRELADFSQIFYKWGG